MKLSTDTYPSGSTAAGFDPHSNGPAAVAQGRWLVVAAALANPPKDRREAEPTLDALAPAVGPPTSARLDNGDFCETHMRARDPALFR